MTPPPSLGRIRDDDELLDALGQRVADPADELSAVLGGWARSIDTDMAIPPSTASVRASRRRKLRRRGLRGAAVVAVFGLTLSGTGVAAAVTDTHLPVLGRLATVTQRLLPHDFHGGTGPTLVSDHEVEPGGAASSGPSGSATSGAGSDQGGAPAAGGQQDDVTESSSVGGDRSVAGRQDTHDGADDGDGAGDQPGSGQAPVPVLPPVSPSQSDASTLPTPSSTTPVPGESATTPPPPSTQPTSPGTSTGPTTTPPGPAPAPTTPGRPSATPNPSRTTATPATGAATAIPLVPGASSAKHSSTSAQDPQQSRQLDQVLPVQRTDQTLGAVAASDRKPVLRRHNLLERRLDPVHGRVFAQRATVPGVAHAKGLAAKSTRGPHSAKGNNGGPATKDASATNGAPATKGAGSRQHGQ
jgi:hypothetical protein